MNNFNTIKPKIINLDSDYDLTIRIIDCDYNITDFQLNKRYLISSHINDDPDIINYYESEDYNTHSQFLQKIFEEPDDDDDDKHILAISANFEDVVDLNCAHGHESINEVIMNKIFTFCRHFYYEERLENLPPKPLKVGVPLHDYFSEWTCNFLSEYDNNFSSLGTLINVADYFGVNALVNIISAKVAIDITKFVNIEEARKAFQVENDFTEEEYKAALQDVSHAIDIDDPYFKSSKFKKAEIDSK